MGLAFIRHSVNFDGYVDRKQLSCQTYVHAYHLFILARNNMLESHDQGVAVPRGPNIVVLIFY